ncbi:neutral zinc metallopeptidase [Nocardia australiensis]|uniref:neutral zinc metallopeptidase n=1 Tax=Nocardia australiensis TaxID=2887191 RepID=UPI001D14B616|nr:neutral zinc metallopeptidase [Nocardia australiensis]
MKATSFRFVPWRGSRGLLAGVACGVVGVLAIAGCGTDGGEKPSAAGVSAYAAAAGSVPYGPMTGATGPAGDGAPPIAAAPLAGVPQSMGSRPVFALADHPLFAQHSGVGRGECKLPAWHDDAESARALYQRAIGCLDDSWGSTLRSVGLPFHTPRLAAPAKAVAADTACAGELRRAPAALYCAADETIVMPFDALRSRTAGSSRGAQLAMLTREYGHHVQALIGIMRAYTDKRTAVGWDSAAGQEQSRRMDLQAWCFAGMFLGTNYGRGDLDQQTWDEASRRSGVAGDSPGDPRLHGIDRSVLNWFTWGSEKGDTWECNTWYSAAATVE